MLDTNRSEYNNFKNLINELMYHNRYTLTKQNQLFLKKLLKWLKNDFAVALSPKITLYRARTNQIEFKDPDGQAKPYSFKKMGAPRGSLSIPGRINPQGISYLYCANDYQTACAEVRPWKGAFVTVAEVIPRKKLMVIDLTKKCSDPKLAEFFRALSSSFSMQWPTESKEYYLITQLLSENIKVQGIHGIKYKSELNEGGINYALFHKSSYKIGETFNVKLMSVKYNFHRPGQG